MGDGNARKNLEKNAPANIHFVGFKNKDELKGLLAKARAFVFAAEEDFGIAIVEALAAGLTVLAYSGGASQELINKNTGILYDKQDPLELNKALNIFLEKEESFKPHVIRESALKFSKKRFQNEFKAFVEETVNINS